MPLEGRFTIHDDIVHECSWTSIGGWMGSLFHAELVMSEFADTGAVTPVLCLLHWGRPVLSRADIPPIFWWSSSGLAYRLSHHRYQRRHDVGLGGAVTNLIVLGNRKLPSRRPIQGLFHRIQNPVRPREAIQSCSGLVLRALDSMGRSQRCSPEGPPPIFFGREGSSGTMGRAFVMVLNCSISSCVTPVGGL